MQKSDSAKFKELLTGAGEEYKIKFSKVRVLMWWERNWFKRKRF